MVEVTGQPRPTRFLKCERRMCSSPEERKERQGKGKGKGKGKHGMANDELRRNRKPLRLDL
jgi:hypothetical protein